jgi:hypothetical protein
MDHTEAVRLQAAAKYALGELSPALMEEYEEHYFDCAECALDVKAVMAFADASCQVFREQDQQATSVKESEPFFDRVFGWLRPVVAVPVLAVLLLFIGYQNAVMIPAAKKHAGVATAQAFRASFTSRGAIDGNESPVQIHEGQPFALAFNFTPSVQFANYVGQIQDESGHVLYQVNMPGGVINRAVHVAVPGGLVQPGKYKLVIAGDSAAKGQFTSVNNVGSVTFVVEFLR